MNRNNRDLDLLPDGRVHFLSRRGGEGENYVLVTFLNAPVSGVLLSPSGGGAKRVRLSPPGLFSAFVL